MGKRDTADKLTLPQRALLVEIWDSEGCDSYCSIYRRGKTVKNADKRTLISLIARGLLHGNGQRIVCTREGDVVAGDLLAAASAQGAPAHAPPPPEPAVAKRRAAGARR